MAKNFKKGLSAILAALMCTGTMSTAAMADETANTYFTPLKLDDIVPSSDEYNYMIAQETFDGGIHYYETSNHTVTIAGAGAVHIFPVIDTTRDVKEDGTWEADGVYECGKSNYNVVYCCDAVTGTRVDEEDVTNTYYKRLNLEDSEYVSVETAERLRAIVSNSYPALTVEEAKAALKAAGFDETLADQLDRSELISATQGAIWILANPDSIDDNTTYRYCKTANAAKKASWGRDMHDYTSDPDEIISFNLTSGFNGWGYKTVKNSGDRITALQDFFLNDIEPKKAEAGQIVITDINMVSREAIDEDTSNVTLEVALNTEVAAEDKIYISAVVNGEETASVQITEGSSVEFTVEADIGAEIKVVVDGEQYLERGVYFYAPKPQDIDGDGIKTSREVSQNLIGVDEGWTTVHAEKTYVINTDKTATPLEDDYTDVTLTVYGEVKPVVEVTEGDTTVDIVIAIGPAIAGYTTSTGVPKAANAVINLVKPLIEEGINVKLGLVGVESMEERVLELTMLDPETYEDFIVEQCLAMLNLHYGTTNLEAPILAAKDMLDKDDSVLAENKYLYVSATGRAYCFDDANGDHATIVIDDATTGKYYWSHYVWQDLRSPNNNIYAIPAVYEDDWSEYWEDIVGWVENDGDQYVYTFPLDKDDLNSYSEWLENNNSYPSPKYGYDIVNPEPDPALVDGIDREYADDGSLPDHALNYERGQYDAWKAFLAVKDAGYNIYSICAEDVRYQNGSPYMEHVGYDTSDIQVGHGFMDFLASLDSDSDDKANLVMEYKKDENGDPVFNETYNGYWVMSENFFPAIDTTNLSGGKSVETVVAYPYVVDYIGFDAEEGYDFDFTGENIVLAVDGDKYITDKNGDIYSFYASEEADEPSFTLEYFRGNGEDEEHFVWYFYETIEEGSEVTLTYQLELVQRNEEIGDHIAYTNQSAVLYPEGDPDNGQVFPEPWVEYENEEPEPEIPEELGTKESELRDRDSNRFEITIDVPGKDGEQSNEHDEVILMVDGSYSGDTEWPAMKEAINAIGETVLNGSGSTQLTLMAFGMGDNEVLVHVKDADELAAALGELPGNLLRGVSSTNCEAGFTGVDEYIKNHDESLKDAIVLYITDGGINTDETPRLFYDWQSYTANKSYTIGFAIEAAAIILDNGYDLPQVIRDVFEQRFAGKSDAEFLDVIGQLTEEEQIALTNAVWQAVFEHSDMDIEEEYPISETERAFLQFDEDYGTQNMALNSFLLAMKNSSYDKYPNVWNRTYASVFALAENSKVEDLYLVRYKEDKRATWMPDAAAASDSDKIQYVKSDSITTLLGALAGTLPELAKTPFNDVVVTDYMSKWVNIDLDTIKIIDNTTGEILWTITDGWAEDVTPLTENVPVVVELVDPADYAYGGRDVIGNTTGDIYKLTWYVKDGAMLRADNYRLAYEVTVDTAEEGFEYEVDYPANGNTDLTYTDENGEEQTNIIDVPDVDAVKIEVDIRLHKVDENGEALTGATFELFDADGESLGEYEVDENGVLTIEGLEAGSYKLVETVTPDGYIGADEPMYFEIVETEDGKFEVKDVYEIEFPATAYEISNHITSVAIPQTFVLLDAEDADDWNYPGEFTFGESEYNVVYCADSETGVEDGSKYYRTDLEDVFTEEKAEKLRAIVANSYPYVSMEEMIEAAIEAGVADAKNLTRGDIIAAVQLAIWHYTNDIEKYSYTTTYSVEAKPGWGKVFNDYSNDLPDYFTDGTTAMPKGSKDIRVYDAASDARIRALYDYLLALDAVTAGEGEFEAFVYVPQGGKDVSQTLIGGEYTDFYTDGLNIYVKNEKIPEEPEETPPTPPTVSFKSGKASNISFMLIDPATGEVEFLKKIDIGGETSFEIPTEEGKISAVFVKQSTSGMFWTSEEVDEDVQDAVVACLKNKKNNPSYKGHWDEFFYGEGDCTWAFQPGKYATYTFTGSTAVLDYEAVVEEPVVEEPVVEEPVVEEPVVEEPVVEEPVVEEPVVEEPVVEEPVVEEPVVEEPVVEEPETPTEPAEEPTIIVVNDFSELNVKVTASAKKGVSGISGAIIGDIRVVYIPAQNKLPAVIWTSVEVDDAVMAEIINVFGDAKIVCEEGSYKFAWTNNNKKSETYTFEIAD